MKKSRFPLCSQNQTNDDPLVEIWILRILNLLGCQRKFIQSHGFSDDALANFLGLDHWDDSASVDFDQRSALIELKEIYERKEKQFDPHGADNYLRKNINKISKLVGLSDIDEKVLEFSVIISNNRMLDDVADLLGVLSSSKVYFVLSVLLKQPEPAIRNSLMAQSILNLSGLVSIERRGTSCLRGKLNLLSEDFADLMISGDANPVDLLKGIVSPSMPAELSLEDYQHIQPALNILVPYMKNALHVGRSGVNIFLHGIPGSGKTQLVRALSAELKCELFEVASEDVDGDPINGDRRLRAFRAAQSFFSKRTSMLAFDEVEDVFNDGEGFWRKSTAQLRKAWINRMLENNQVPTIWLSNSVRGLDAAFIRRFDMVIELTMPSRKQREKILRLNCGDLLDDQRIARIAESSQLAPAVVAKASSVIHSIQHELGQQDAGAAFERLVTNTMAAQGHAGIGIQSQSVSQEIYDPSFISASHDLGQVAQGLSSSPSARLCLYGPAGTGKTAFGRWLAGQLGLPLLEKRASDLMSMWVGGNEKNIANAFREAREEGALLLIDEIDSFLQDRRDAQRGWEVTMVNEMLTQMESFSGVFIATTNLIKELDQAALRRFDLKVKFDYLQPQSSQKLFIRYCEALKLSQPKAETIKRIADMHLLTPGDFATVARRHRFQVINDPDALVNALTLECAVKEGGKQSIGYY